MNSLKKLEIESLFSKLQILLRFKFVRQNTGHTTAWRRQ